MSNLSHIIDHVSNNDLFFNLEFQQQIAKTMANLLEIRRSENYSLQSLEILAELERKVNASQPIDETDKGVSLCETIRTTVICFPELTDDEESMIKGYLKAFLYK